MGQKGVDYQRVGTVQQTTESSHEIQVKIDGSEVPSLLRKSSTIGQCCGSVHKLASRYDGRGDCYDEMGSIKECWFIARIAESSVVPFTHSRSSLVVRRDSQDVRLSAITKMLFT